MLIQLKLEQRKQYPQDGVQDFQQTKLKFQSIFLNSGNTIPLWLPKRWTGRNIVKDKIMLDYKFDFFLLLKPMSKYTPGYRIHGRHVSLSGGKTGLSCQVFFFFLLFGVKSTQMLGPGRLPDKGLLETLVARLPLSRCGA